MKDNCGPCPRQPGKTNEAVLEFKQSRSVNIQSLLQGRRQLAIEHEGRYYILRIGRNNRLTLTR